MSVSDPIGDMLTRIRNAVGRKKTKVSTPASKLRARVLDVLQSEGYIRGYTQSEFVNGKAEIEIELKYYEGVPVIRELTRVSKPGRRVYVSVKSIPQVANGLGISILSTPKGLMAYH
jgi:small subunit ribosomal protein S8